MGDMEWVIVRDHTQDVVYHMRREGWLIKEFYCFNTSKATRYPASSFFYSASYLFVFIQEFSSVSLFLPFFNDSGSVVWYIRSSRS